MARFDLIQIRGDTAANWTVINPVLAAREQGMETDTRKFKLGDGTTAWNSLTYWDCTGSGDGAVTNAKLANVATATFKGRTTAGTGSPEDLTATQATALLNTFSSTLKGLAPASGGGTTNFLRADGTWAAPAGGGGGTTTNALTINNGGAGAASGTTFNGSAAITISYNTVGAARAGAITAGDLTIATARLAGRTTAATGAIEEISVGANLSLSAGVLNTGATVALLASPALTGTPTAPTAAAGTNTTQLATTAFAIAADAAFKPASGTASTSFSAADADTNTYKVLSGATQTLTLGSITAGVNFTYRFTTAWSISCAGGLSKNGASPSGITSGSVAANSIISFFHEGSGVWAASGSGLT